MGVSKNQIGLYIHIPFCRSKCYYCDFNSFPNKEDYIDPYFRALKKEVIHYSKKLKGYSIKTIFIGGGTPSFVAPQYIYEIVELCSDSFNITKDAEISLEANPGTLNTKKLGVYKTAGINRLSIGLQAWQDYLLKQIGRIHSAHEFVENLGQARKLGFNNINVDLIFGLPGQTIEDWQYTLEQVIRLNIPHVSAYSLKIEEGTVFGKMVSSEKLIPLEDEIDREMYHLAIKKLKRNGLKHYEISNFAAPGFECRHNLIYWNAESYLGLGAGAHSYIQNKRFNNVCDIEEYIISINNYNSPVESEQLIDEKDAMAEFMILGLRLVQGIDSIEFKSRFGKDIFDVYKEQINKLLNKGFLVIYKNRIKLSPIGLDLANRVFVEFID